MPKFVKIEIKMNANNIKFNIIFPIPWYSPFSNAWNTPLNNPTYDLNIISIVKSNVIVIVSSSDFIIIKIINIKKNDPIEKMIFNGIIFPKCFGAES